MTIGENESCFLPEHISRLIAEMATPPRVSLMERCRTTSENKILILSETFWRQNPLGEHGILSTDRKTLFTKNTANNSGVAFSNCVVHKDTGKWVKKIDSEKTY